MSGSDSGSAGAERVAEGRQRILNELRKIIVGQDDIVDQVLRDAGVPAAQVVWRLSGEYETRLHTTQYGESDWAFVERMLAEEGVSYWFDFLDDQHPILVFGDDPASHEGMPGGTKLPFQDAGGLVGPRHLSRLEIEQRLTTTAVQVRDYDVRAPDVYLDGKAGEGAFEHFEYPARVLTTRGAEQRAKVRLQQHERLKVLARGVCDCVRVQPGRVVELGEGVGERALLAGEEVDREGPGVAHHGRGAGGVAGRDQHDGRVDGDREEGRGGEAVVGAREVVGAHRDHGDAGGIGVCQRGDRHTVDDTDNADDDDRLCS